MYPDTPNTPTTRLSELDARLLDLLVEQGPQALPADDPRAQRILALWSLLGNWPALQADKQADKAMVRRTLEAIAASPTFTPSTIYGLSDSDGDVLDALLASRRMGQTTGPLPAGSAARARALTDLLSLLDQAPAQQPPADLAARTLARVAAERDADRRLRFAGQDQTHRHAALAFGLPQIGTAAALVLISLSVLLPVLSKSRIDAQATACQNNLAHAGMGLAAYSQEHDGLLPQNASNVFSLLSRFAEDATHQSPTDAAVPASQINLFLLPKQGYVASDELVCPATPRGEVTNYYNAQNAIAGGPIRLADLSAPMLADNNPLYRLGVNGLVRRENLPDDAASNNHAATGQNVLNHDGSVRWLIKPTLQHNGRQDNLWLHDATPGQPDAFLTP